MHTCIHFTLCNLFRYLFYSALLPTHTIQMMFIRIIIIPHPKCHNIQIPSMTNYIRATKSKLYKCPCNLQQFNFVFLAVIQISTISMAMNLSPPSLADLTFMLICLKMVRYPTTRIWTTNSGMELGLTAAVKVMMK